MTVESIGDHAKIAPRHLLNSIDAAIYIGGVDTPMSQSFMKNGRTTGTGPRFIKLGRRVRYDVQDLEAWLSANKRQNTIRMPQTLDARKRAGT